MKKYIVYLMISMFLITIIPTQRAEATINTEVSQTKRANAAKASMLIDRLNKIKESDISSLSFSEKIQLRKEVNGIKRQLKELDGGVYLSVGAIIIILLILILIF